MCWNVRGITSLSKQKDVKSLLSTRPLGLVSLIETKVKVAKMGRMYQNLFSRCFCTNYSFHSGGRIIVAWKEESFNVNICFMYAQMIHCQLHSISNKKDFYYTFVYAFNTADLREELWGDLERIAMNMRDPWVVLGDFNCVLDREEKIGGPVRDHDMVSFRRCVANCALDDMKSTRCYYTWNNKQSDGSRVFCKLDRVLCNVSWSEMFPTAETWFLPEGLFDHSPCYYRYTK